MTITISRNYFWEIFFEDEPTKQRYDPADEFDILWQYPCQFGKGYCREIELQQGLGLLISDYQLRDRLTIKVPERDGDVVQCGFRLAGGSEGCHSSEHKTFKTGQYDLTGSSARPSGVTVESEAQRQLMVNVSVSPERFRSFAGNKSGELDLTLQHLIRQPDRECYNRYGTTTSAMQIVLQQILHCPYQGTPKRMYLQSKALELMTFLVTEELEIKQSKQNSTALKLDDIDCIYHARNILLGNLDNPPSLIELARQVGLNERKLKEGFRYCFGTTVFGYLHDYRMEQARLLLIAGQLSVKQVARVVGYASPTSFHAAFRKKFGINPGDYLKRS
ncbi:helix-turn-helix transcriptional regulator [Tolypothrix sp. VBCCA 56010]|uniref:helix-turn-helix transcriptional regulator n=1 Tax=Tolypothrix sp. VBCCA 56010 TaxID=3137731 RepID=UPI003D7F0F7C